MTRSARAPRRLRHAIGAIVVLGLLAIAVVGCGSSTGRTENTGEPGIPAPTAREEAEVGIEGTEDGPAGRRQEAGELIEETKQQANQIVEEAEQRAFEGLKEAKEKPSLTKGEKQEAKREANEAIDEAKESAKLALERAKAKAKELRG